MGGQSRDIEYLINGGGDVNAKNINGNTPLHLAAMNGHTEVAEKLITCGALLNARNNLAETPFMIAIANGHTNLATMLLVDKEADPNIEDFLDLIAVGVVSPLHIAMAKKDQAMTQLLLLCGARPYARKGSTVRYPLLPPQMISNIYGKCTQDRRTMHLVEKAMGAFIPNVFRNIASFLHGDTMAKIIVGHNFRSLSSKKIDPAHELRAIGSKEDGATVSSDCTTVGSDDENRADFLRVKKQRYN
jgi:hypothetical protein